MKHVPWLVHMSQRCCILLPVLGKGTHVAGLKGTAFSAEKRAQSDFQDAVCLAQVGSQERTHSVKLPTDYLHMDQGSLPHHRCRGTWDT